MTFSAGPRRSPLRPEATIFGDQSNFPSVGSVLLIPLADQGREPLIWHISEILPPALGIRVMMFSSHPILLLYRGVRKWKRMFICFFLVGNSQNTEIKPDFRQGQGQIEPLRLK